MSFIPSYGWETYLNHPSLLREAVIYSVLYGDTGLLRALLKYSENKIRLKRILETLNVYGLNCLHQTCIDGNATLLLIILEFGVNVNARTIKGWSAVDITIVSRNLSLIPILLNYGADLSLKICGKYFQDNKVAHKCLNKFCIIYEATGFDYEVVLNEFIPKWNYFGHRIENIN